MPAETTPELAPTPAPEEAPARATNEEPTVVANEYAVLGQWNNINHHHEAVTYLEQRGDVREMQFRRISLQNMITIARAAQEVFPHKLLSKKYRNLDTAQLAEERVDPAKLPPLLDVPAVVFRPNQQPTATTETRQYSSGKTQKPEATQDPSKEKTQPKKKVAIFIEPGILMSPGSLVPLMQEIYKQHQERGEEMPFEIGLMAAFGSSVSIDTLGDFSPDTVTRIASRVAMQQALLRENGDIDEVFTIAHSLSGQEQLWEKLLLEKALATDGRSKQITHRGSILLNPGGQYDQNFLRFLAKLPKNQSQQAENAEVETHLKGMTIPDKPSTPEEHAALSLKELDEQIAQVDEKTKKELLKVRHRILYHEFQRRHHGAETRPDKKLADPRKITLPSLLAALPIAKATPKGVREQTIGDVFGAVGTRDALFAAEEAVPGIDSYPLKNANPHQTIVMEGASHLHITADPKATAELVLDIMIGKENASPEDTSDTPEQNSTATERKNFLRAKFYQ